MHALGVVDGKLCAGGAFTTMGGVSTSKIACWDPVLQIWSALGPGARRDVLALAELDGTPYAGGLFTSIGGVGSAQAAALVTILELKRGLQWVPELAG
jgi:hypothetical protein